MIILQLFSQIFTNGKILQGVNIHIFLQNIPVVTSYNISKIICINVDIRTNHKFIQKSKHSPLGQNLYTMVLTVL